MDSHLETEIVGLANRIDDIERRQGRQELINCAIANYAETDETELEQLKRIVTRLTEVVEKQQAQIEELNEIVGELMPDASD